MPLPNNVFIIIWQPIASPPQDGSYILIKCINESGQVVSEPAAYEGGRFLYIYDRDTWGEINRDLILGWSYYPYDDRSNKL